jgi:hypothetical protein
MGSDKIGFWLLRACDMQQLPTSTAAAAGKDKEQKNDCSSSFFRQPRLFYDCTRSFRNSRTFYRLLKSEEENT